MIAGDLAQMKFRLIISVIAIALAMPLLASIASAQVGDWPTRRLVRFCEK